MHRLSQIIFFLFLLNVYNLAQSPHGENFNYDCSDCHTTDSWKVIPEEISFDHAQTGFMLEGQHKSVNCLSCHTSLKFSSAPKECFQCHTDMHRGSVGFNCERCHNNNSWIVEDINTLHMESRFPLLGNHLTADCSDCHENAKELLFEPLSVECISCHLTDYNSTQNPDHRAAGFSTECQDCHQLNSITWSFAATSHDFFPLTGGHAIGNCFECHQVGTYEGLSQECYSCHQSDYETTTDPNHVANSFSTNCIICHTLIPGWQPANFINHDDIYALIGAHDRIRTQCESCHASGYTNTPTDCIGCHQSDYNNTTDPNHSASNFSTSCEECHSQDAWTPSTFDHDGMYFPIYTGSHAGAWDQCIDCHTVASNFQIFSCIDCHEHNKTDTDNEHGGINGYLYENSACYSCHPTGSGEGSFDHSTGNFPLTGMHATLQCVDCHINGYANTSMECYSCHQEQYNSAPEHVSQGYPTTCEQCHITSSWGEVNFDHNTTNFPLTGSHIPLTCNSCHTSGIAGTPTDCYSCHQDKYNSAENHVSQGYPTTCEQCHNTNTWDDADFDHNTTNFPLTGAHIPLTCDQCHTTGIGSIPTECSSCHTEDFQSTTNPAHSSIGIPNTCDDCHSTQPGWQPATFPIHNNYYQLLGAHANIADNCAQCHNGNYNTTPNTCYQCHSDNYNNTTNPDHTAADFPTDCEQCHSQSAWTPATFDHDGQYFPIYSGNHINEWNTCADCHTVASNYAVFSCIDCHEHNKTDTDNEHNDVGSYVYDSQACYNCHPTGSEGDGGGD